MMAAGAWSDSSSLWTPELRQICNSQAAEDGVFFMELSDVVTWFECFTICEYRDGWHEQRVPIELRGQNQSMQGLLLTGHGEATEATVSLHQPSLRGQSKGSVLTSMAVGIFCRAANRQWQLVSSSPLQLSDQVAN